LLKFFCGKGWGCRGRYNMGKLIQKRIYDNGITLSIYEDGIDLDADEEGLRLLKKKAAARGMRVEDFVNKLLKKAVTDVRRKP
jgi:predicted DNA binding CopG/RHH family protein